MRKEIFQIGKLYTLIILFISDSIGSATSGSLEFDELPFTRAWKCVGKEAQRSKRKKGEWKRGERFQLIEWLDYKGDLVVLESKEKNTIVPVFEILVKNIIERVEQFR